VRTPLAGRHNVLNSLAAISVGLKLDLSFEKITEALSTFRGVGRRIEEKGEAAGVLVVDDYGHHPTEIKATLSAVKSRWPKRRLVVLFQPHRFTRTKILCKEFAQSLAQVEKLLLLPIYSAGEKPIPGVSSKSIARHLKKKNFHLFLEKPELEILAKELNPGDVLLTLGAGDVWKLGEQFLQFALNLSHRMTEDFPELKDRIKSEEPLSRHCTWAIGGPAEVYIEIHNVDEFKKIQNWCKQNEKAIFILGWGSNILIPDEGLRGVVLRLRGEFEAIQFHNDRVTVGAGVHLPKLARLCVEKGLSGVEALAGVPGTVGGALMTNAGTPRGVIGDVVQEVEILDSDGKIEKISKANLDFQYRKTNLKGKWVLSAQLALQTSNNGSAREKLKWELETREKTQPLGTKNVGSVFKNPANDHAGRLIEAAGLKGKVMGRMRISPKHANFIENTGGGTAHEAKQLIELAQNTVKEKFNIDLQTEVIFVQQPEPMGKKS
jgi:UDP-N-acetylenolpyruvoylglucosamine reductase